MTTFDAWLALPVVQQLGWVLLHFVWQGIFIGILCGALLRLPLAKKPRAAYGICLSGLFLCALAPVVTFYAVEPMDVPPVLLSGPSLPADAHPAQPPAPVFVPEAKDLTAGFADMRHVPELETPPPWHARVLTALAPYVPWLVVMWLPIAALLSARLTWEWGQTRLWVRAGTPVSDEATQRRLAALCARIGVRGKVLLLESARVLGPLTVGFFKPAILLPVGFMAGVSPAHLEAILLHELAHIRRWDYALNLLVAALTALLFYHPVVWWLDRRTRLARELCCDALAANRYGDLPAYAQALAQVESRLHGGHSVAPAAGDSSLVQRIRTLAGHRGVSGLTGRSLANLTAIFALTLGAALLLQFASASDAKNVADALQKPAPNGRVLNAQGDPQPGAVVSLYHRKDSRGLDNGIVETVKTAADGRFAFTQALRYVEVPGDFWDDTYYVVVYAPEQALAFAILDREAAKTQELSLRLSRPQTRLVSVTDKAGNPLPDATVSVRWISLGKGKTAYFENPFGPLEVKTDAQAVAVFSQLPQGRIAFRAVKAGFAPNWTRSSSDDQTEFVVQLPPSASVRGRVVSNTGAPLAGIRVYAEPRWPLIDYASVLTDADGRFVLEGLYGKGDAWDPTGGDGRYRMGIESPDYCAPAVDVVLTSGQEKSVDEWKAWTGARIRGVLLDPVAQKPLPGMDLAISTTGGNSHVLTDARGRFQFLAPDGRFDVLVWQPPKGYYLMDEAQGDPIFNGEAGGKPQELTLHSPAPLGRLGSVRARVLTSDGKPVADASVVIRLKNPGYLKADRMGGDTFGPVETDARGVCEFAKYPKGIPLEIVAFCASDAVVTQANPVPVEADAIPDIVLKKGWSPRICVTDAGGRPLAGQKITYGIQPKGDLKVSNGIPPVSFHLTRETKTDDKGFAVFEGIPEGAVCDFWLKGKPITWKRVSPDMLLAGGIPSFVLSEKMRVQCLDPNGDPIQIKRLEKDPVGFENPPSTGEFSLVISRDGIDENAVAEGWMDVSKALFSFTAPGSEIKLWAQRKDGYRMEVSGVLPIQNNKVILRAVRDGYSRAVTPTPPFSMGYKDAAYLVVDEQGRPMPDVRVRSVRVFGTESPIDTRTDAQGWCLLKDFNKRSSTPTLEFTYPGYAPAWSSSVFVRLGVTVIMSKGARVQGRFLGPQGQPTGEVSLRFFVERELPIKGVSTVGFPSITELDYRVKTDAQGAYDILITPGTYSVHGESEKGFFLEEKVFEIGPNQTRSLAQRMQDGAKVTLRCTDISTGKPAPGMRVCIYESTGVSMSGPRKDSERVGDAEGRVVWNSLPPWRTCFALMGSPYARWWSALDIRQQPIPSPYAENLPRFSAGLGNLIFNLKSGSQEIAVVAEQGIYISGKVVLPPKVVGINTLWISVIPVGKVPTYDAMWRCGGIFANIQTGEFSGWLPAGNGVDYRLQARAMGKPKEGNTPTLPMAVSDSFSSRPGEHFRFELSMLGGGYIKGRVLDAQGKPRAKLELRYKLADSVVASSGDSVIMTGTDGHFSIGPIRAGEYDFREIFVVRRSSDPEPTIQRAVVREGETTDLGDIVF